MTGHSESVEIVEVAARSRRDLVEIAQVRRRPRASVGVTGVITSHRVRRCLRRCAREARRALPLG